MKSELLKKYNNLSSFENVVLEGFDQPGIDADTPIHFAAYLGYFSDVKQMLKEIRDINIKGDIGNTPLHMAVLNNHLSVSRLLLENGADPCAINDCGDSILDYVPEEGGDDIRILIESAIKNWGNRNS